RASWTTPSTRTVTSTATSRKSTSADPLSRPGPSGSEDTVHGGLEHLAERLTGQCPDQHHQSRGHQRHHHPPGYITPLGFGAHVLDPALPPAACMVSYRPHRPAPLLRGSAAAGPASLCTTCSFTLSVLLTRCATPPAPGRSRTGSRSARSRTRPGPS